MASRRLSALGLAALAGLILAPAGPAASEEHSVTSRDVRAVLELFTSQSCRDCQPAGALAARLGAAPGVVVLAYHVDYWDYTGWRDQLADRRNTDRQKAYAKRLKLGALVTPQVVVNGRSAVDGSDETAVIRALAAAPLARAPASGEVRMRTEGDALHIEAIAPRADPARPPPVLVLVTYVQKVETAVPVETDADGTRVDHYPVRDWRILGSVDRETMEVEMPLGMLTENGADGLGLAVLLQTVGSDNKPGPILAAAALEF